MSAFTDDELARYWSKVAKGEGCWLWTASLGNHGYGQMGARGTVMLAHRIAYEIANGPIPEGLTVDHLCMTPSCQNPAHLEVVSRAENARRAHLSGQCHCHRNRKKAAA